MLSELWVKNKKQTYSKTNSLEGFHSFANPIFFFRILFHFIMVEPSDFDGVLFPGWVWGDTLSFVIDVTMPRAWPLRPVTNKYFPPFLLVRKILCDHKPATQNLVRYYNHTCRWHDRYMFTTTQEAWRYCGCADSSTWLKIRKINKTWTSPWIDVGVCLDIIILLGDRVRDEDIHVDNLMFFKNIRRMELNVGVVQCVLLLLHARAFQVHSISYSCI